MLFSLNVENYVSLFLLVVFSCFLHDLIGLFNRVSEVGRSWDFLGVGFQRFSSVEEDVG